MDRAKLILQKACKQNKKDYLAVLSGTRFIEIEMQMTKKENDIHKAGNNVEELLTIIR